MIWVYCCMFLQLSLQNQRHFAGKPFVLSGTNVFLIGGLLPESVIFSSINSYKAQGKYNYCEVFKMGNFDVFDWENFS